MSTTAPTPTLDFVRQAELLRDCYARQVADAVADGTLDERAWLLTTYREYREAHEAARAAWSARVDALLDDRSAVAS